ncbi:hypothetical protein [Alicyclobacillus kakegawensis]|uniref:hypothetical protein n=1 Tax=Alicyclobacillus kakegawensis TaxID=392012 RepID=UPI00082E2875|nr:hypothetical protein [Alicyclobacillus kakegawensis]
MARENEDFRAVEAWLNQVQDSMTQLRDWVKTRGSFNSDQTKQLLEMSVEFMEYETKMYGSTLETEVSDILTANLAMRLRGLRDSLNRIIATSLVRRIEEKVNSPEDFGITVDWLKNGFVITLPYSMISMSDLYLMRSKRISNLTGLNTVWNAWGTIIRSVQSQRPVPTEMIWRATVRVDIFVEHRVPLDPDHFWIRPILDALVNQRFLADDDAEHIIFMLHYHLRSKNPRVTISIQSLDNQE